MGTVMRVKMYVRLGRENIYRCFKEEEEEEEEKKKILSRSHAFPRFVGHELENDKYRL